MKWLAPIFVLLFACLTPALAQDYMDSYNRGSLAVQLGNCAEGESLLQDALKINPKGDFRKNYFPHYYLAICAVEHNDMEAAKKYSKQAEGSGISFSSLAKDYSKFKSQLQQRLKEPKQEKLVLAVVVNTENSIDNITLEDLRKIYKGEKKTWDNGTTIIPVLGPEGSRENSVFLQLVSGTDEKGLQELWKAQKATPPARIEKNEWILRFVFSNPGAIAFFPATGTMQQVKAIKVDGRQSADPDYSIAVK